MEKVNLAEKLELFDDHFAPKTVATLNDYDVHVVKALGDSCGDDDLPAHRKPDRDGPCDVEMVQETFPVSGELG